MEYHGLSADFSSVYATTAERRTEWACHMGTLPVALRPWCKSRAKKSYRQTALLAETCENCTGAIGIGDLDGMGANKQKKIHQGKSFAR